MEDCNIICIDGGGTKTKGVLFLCDKKISEIKLGATRVGPVDLGEACDRVLQIIVGLCNGAGITTSEVDVVVVGLAGVWLEWEKKRAMGLLKTLANTAGYTLNDLIVTSDAEIALKGAFNDNRGIITIVGTGSIGLAKIDSTNHLERCGGWGIELDDEGSGAWIGREAVTAVVRAIDGRGESTILTDKLVETIPQFDISNPRSIVSAYNNRSFEYHSLTPLVMECAEKNDKISMGIIKRSAKHLAELPTTLLKHFPEQEVEVALMGGIIDNDTYLCKLLKEELSLNSRIKLITPIADAIEGARKIGINIIEELQNNC